MMRERLSQIRQAINHNPRGVDGYVDELLRACVTLLGDCDAARGDRDDTLAVLARIAEQVGVSAEALVEDATLIQNRMVALMAARDEAIESARATIRHAQEQKVEAMRQRDAARAEVEMLRGVGCGEPSFIGAEIEDGPCGYQITEHAYQEMASVLYDLPTSAAIEQFRAEFPEVMP